MIGDGYVWTDHFENLGGGAPGVTRTPDFVFSRPGTSGVALVESKGTRIATPSAFDARVQDGYLHQVEPHLGHSVGGAMADHGFCVGGWLTSTTKAELNVHHTDPVPVPTGGPGGAAPGTVQRGNYATALRLAHSEGLARQVRRGVLESGEIPFWEFEWIGRRFLTAFILSPPAIGFPSPPPWPHELTRNDFRAFRTHAFGVTGFAVERETVAAVLRALAVAAGQPPDAFQLEPMSTELSARARDASGTLFPDGLAVVTGRSRIASQTVVVWSTAKRDFVTR
jgi:hypothetical protein